MADPTPPAGGDLGALVRELEGLRRRVGDLEAPSGTQRYQSVQKLQALIDDIQAQLDAYMLGKYTNAQIDAKDAAVAGQIQPAINATLAGSVTVGGAFYNPDAVAYSITGTRRTAWLEDATGRHGYAPSTLREKAVIQPADEKRLVGLLGIVPKSFVYRAEVAKQAELACEGIEYMPPRELGLIAEELDAAGLHEFVLYDTDGRPEGIEYSMLVVAQQAVLRHLNTLQLTQQKQIDVLTARLDALDTGGTDGAH